MDAYEMEIFAEASDRANRGAAWLDAAKPGWEPRITRPIDLQSDTKCLLGQAFGSFYLTEQRYGSNGDWATRHGFIDDDDAVTTRHLTLAWDALPYQRRRAKRPVAVPTQTPCRWNSPPAETTSICPPTHHPARRRSGHDRQRRTIFGSGAACPPHAPCPRAA